jgi:hypothetical protein
MIVNRITFSIENGLSIVVNLSLFFQFVREQWILWTCLSMVLLFSFSCGWQHRKRAVSDFSLQVESAGRGEAYAMDIHPSPFIVLNGIPQMWWSCLPCNYWFPTCGGCIIQSFPYPWLNTPNVSIFPASTDTMPMQKDKVDCLVEEKVIVLDTIAQNPADSLSRWDRVWQGWRNFLRRRKQEP